VSRFGSKKWHLPLAWLLAIAVIVGVVIALGGFNERDDQQVEVPVGEWVSLNNIDIRVLKAEGTKDEDRFNVVIYAEVINTASMPLSDFQVSRGLILGYYTNEDFLIKDVTVEKTLDNGEKSPGRIFPPFDGVEVPVVMEVSIVEDIDLDRPLRVGLFPVHLIDNNVLGLSDHKTWYYDPGQPKYWTVDVSIELH
jgi:hypothetical protein